MTGPIAHAKALAVGGRDLVRDAGKLRSQPLDEIMRLGSLEEAALYPRRNEVVCFNGQLLRTLWIFSTISKLSITHFLETGTFLAFTSLTVCRHFALPTSSVDIASGFVRRARVLSFAVLGPRATRYRLERGDSRTSLRGWLSDLPASAVPLVYLDAHSNALKTQPLIDEVAICLERGRCAVVIDDFRIPNDPGFGYDSANGFEIGLGTLGDALDDDRINLRLPSYAASSESGYRRGAAALLIDLDLDLDDTFPGNLFEEIDRPTRLELLRHL